MGSIEQQAVAKKTRRKLDRGCLLLALEAISWFGGAIIRSREVIVQPSAIWRDDEGMLVLVAKILATIETVNFEPCQMVDAGNRYLAEDVPVILSYADQSKQDRRLAVIGRCEATP